MDDFDPPPPVNPVFKGLVSALRYMFIGVAVWLMILLAVQVVT